MYTILYLRDLGRDQREHRRIECNSIVDADRIFQMLRKDKSVFDLSLWQGKHRMDT